MGRDDIAGRLASFACTGVADPTALEVLRLSLLDWAAVGLAGRGEPVARILRRQAEDEGGAGHAGLIGSPLMVPARMAALVNGTTSHALDYDDTHFGHIGHPSVAVLPAAMAVGEMLEAQGDAVQEAALLGVETSVRVGLWLGRAHYQSGFHQTATAGAFGATVAAGRLLRLSEAQMGMALGLVATRASGLRSQFGTMGKPMNAGIAAANGVEAASLAAKGMVSAPEAVGGALGFGATHAGEDVLSALDGLGQTWLFPEVRHKFHACCHGLHAMLEALADFGGACADISRVEVSTHPRWLSVCNQPAPQTGLEAKFSYRMVAAMALLGHDTARPSSFSDALCRDGDIVALRDRVAVRADQELSEMQARVIVQDEKGAETVLFHDLDICSGLDIRRDKVRKKAATLLGEDMAELLWARITADSAPGRIMEVLAAG